MAIIDDAGAKSIARWFNNNGKDESKVITLLTDKNPLILNVSNNVEKANLEIILRKNGIKFIIEDPGKISNN